MTTGRINQLICRRTALPHWETLPKKCDPFIHVGHHILLTQWIANWKNYIYLRHVTISRAMNSDHNFNDWCLQQLKQTQLNETCEFHKIRRRMNVLTDMLLLQTLHTEDINNVTKRRHKSQQCQQSLAKWLFTTTCYYTAIWLFYKINKFHDSPHTKLEREHENRAPSSTHFWAVQDLKSSKVNALKKSSKSLPF